VTIGSVGWPSRREPRPRPGAVVRRGAPAVEHDGRDATECHSAVRTDAVARRRIVAQVHTAHNRLHSSFKRSLTILYTIWRPSNPAFRSPPPSYVVWESNILSMPPFRVCWILILRPSLSVAVRKLYPVCGSILNLIEPSGFA
jgi:hypothetical protein